MTIALLQILMIADMIKIEFKITVPDGHGAYIEKMINSIEDYKQFKKELVAGIQSLDLIINNKLEKLTNGTQSNTGNRLP